MRYENEQKKRERKKQKLDNGKRKIHIQKLHLFVCTHMRLQY